MRSIERKSMLSPKISVKQCPTLGCIKSSNAGSTVNIPSTFFNFNATYEEFPMIAV